MLYNEKINDSTLKINVKYQDISLKQLKEERLKDYRAQQNGGNPDTDTLPESPDPVPEPESPKNVGKELFYPYKKRMLLTKSEHTFYLKFKVKCDKNSYTICPKVRLEDVAGVDEEEIAKLTGTIEGKDYERERYRDYIKSKHIDFIICDKELRLLAGVELDGGSHLNPEVAKKDEFKNMLFLKINLPLYRIEDKEDQYDEQIDSIIEKIKESQEEKISLLLHVPFDRNENEKLKQLGAKWSPKEGKWYVKNWNNYPKFDKWILGDAEEKLVVHDAVYVVFVKEECSLSIDQKHVAFGIEKGLKIRRDKNHKFIPEKGDEKKLLLFSYIAPVPEGIVNFVQELDESKLPFLAKDLYDLDVFQFTLRHDLVLDDWKELKTIPFIEALVKPGIKI